MIEVRLGESDPAPQHLRADHFRWSHSMFRRQTLPFRRAAYQRIHGDARIGRSEARKRTAFSSCVMLIEIRLSAMGGGSSGRQRVSCQT